MGAPSLRYGTRELSSALYVVTRLQLGSRHSALVQQLVSRLLPPAAEGVERWLPQSLAAGGNAVDVSTTAWSLARLLLDSRRREAVGPGDGPGGGPCVRPSTSGVPSSCTACWACLEHALRSLLVAADRTSRSMGPQELSNTTWALAKVAVLAERASRTFEDEEEGFEDEEEPQSPPPQQAHVVSPADRREAAEKLPSPTLLPMLRACLSGPLGARAVELASSGALGRQHAPNVAWACARLGHRDAALLDALACCLMGQLRNVTSQGLSISLWAYARLGYRHDALVAAVARAATWKARKFRGKGLSNLAWALMTFR